MTVDSTAPVGHDDSSRASGRPGEESVHPSVLLMRDVGGRRSVEDAELIAATAAVVAAVRDAVLGRRGLVEAELGRTQAAAVDQEVRNLAVAELQLAIGFGVTEARAMVAAATAPDELRAVLDRALRRGEASWPLVRAFLDRSTRLSAEQRLLVALALFGDDAALAHEDRLDPDGRLHRHPWGHARFGAALDGEVTACLSTDPDDERARRAEAHARRRTTLKVHDDGTATLRVSGPAATMVAAAQRVDRAARTLRRVGDPRTLDQLRADTVSTLLLYGDVPLPGEPREDNRGEGEAEEQDGLFDETLAPEDVEHIARVINALPSVQLQVVVPFNALAGGFPICASCGGPTSATRAPVSPPAGRSPGARPPSDRSASERPSPDRPSSDRQSDDRPLPDRPPYRSRPVRGPMAEVLGPHPFFITDGHARELALLPGTTLHRLVVDPRDGRLVERTIQTYRPDTDMRRQVVAADLYSRAPGSRLGAHTGELDHVTPYGWAGGPTSETNLALLAKRPHQFKTDGAWRMTIDDRRDLTITTVLGQVVTTRVHDYRTYLRTRHPEDLDARRDLANKLVYAALAARPGSRRDVTGQGDGTTVDWTARNGATYEGPSPSDPTLDDLLDGPEPTTGREADDGEATA